MRERATMMLSAVTAALQAWDPVRIAFADEQEYEPEARRILDSLSKARSAQDVQQIVHQVFVYQFGADMAGPLERYEGVAARIWQEHAEVSEL